MLDVMEHDGWVRVLARKIDGGQGLEDDLYQEGMVGLLQAWERFDGTRNDSFRRYAYARVRGAMRDFVRKYLPGERGDGKPWRPIWVDSLDREMEGRKREEGSVRVGDSVGADGQTAKARFRMLCGEVLTGRERRIIEHVYFEEREALELERELGVSACRISQIHTGALRKLREVIRDPGDMGDFEGVVGGRKVRRPEEVKSWRYRERTQRYARKKKAKSRGNGRTGGGE